MHEPLVGGRRVGHQPQPLCRAQLHRVAAHGARRPGHRQRPTGPERQLVECEARRETVHGQRCRLNVRRPPRCSDDRLGGHDHALGVATPGPERQHDGHHAVPHLELGDDPGTDLLEHAGDVHARHMGRRHVLEPLRPGSTAELGVGGVDRGGPDVDPDLARPRLGVGQLDHVQDLGAAEPGDPHRSHRTAA